jgi:glycosyltransferase involved in cell wall biosynthesis
MARKTKPTGAAIYYHPDGFDASRPKLMGRHVAGESFLAAMARHAATGPLVAFTNGPQNFDDFQARVTKADPARETRLIPFAEPERLVEAGCLFTPQPPEARMAWARRRIDQRAFSLCGVCHTTASATVMQSFADLLTAPIQSWDAVICPSQSVRTTLERIVDDYDDYLAQRVGRRVKVRPQLPIIPLGIDSAAFTPDDASTARGQALRQQLNVPAEALVVLFVGRLAFHGKAHPLPLYLALEAATQDLDQEVVLLLAGWTANDFIAAQFRDGARSFCPSVRTVILDGRRPEVRRDVWHAADIFTSPSDSVQETFGLTPLEAMAAGLPCVLSDWDGYRETLRHEKEGFLVPTWAAPPGSGEELAQRYLLEEETYDTYIGKAGQLTAVEVAPMAEAFKKLGTDPELRRRMGEAGRARVRDLYDWSAIIPQYEALWGELAARRAKDKESAPPKAGRPAVPVAPDPFTIFAHYPTHALTEETRVRLTLVDEPERIKTLVGFKMNTLAGGLMPPAETSQAMLSKLAEASVATVIELIELAPPGERHAVERAIIWLAKLGIVRLENEET